MKPIAFVPRVVAFSCVGGFIELGHIQGGCELFDRTGTATVAHRTRGRTVMLVVLVVLFNALAQCFGG